MKPPTGRSGVSRSVPADRLRPDIIWVRGVARHNCGTPSSAKLGSVWTCPGCHQMWWYTHDNIASCFWVYAPWWKRTLAKLGGVSS